MADYSKSTEMEWVKEKDTNQTELFKSITMVDHWEI
jgi:hypothetical protein